MYRNKQNVHYLPANDLVVRVVLELVSLLAHHAGLLVCLVLDGDSAGQGPVSDAEKFCPVKNSALHPDGRG